MTLYVYWHTPQALPVLAFDLSLSDNDCLRYFLQYSSPICVTVYFCQLFPLCKIGLFYVNSRLFIYPPIWNDLKVQPKLTTYKNSSSSLFSFQPHLIIFITRWNLLCWISALSRFRQNNLNSWSTELCEAFNSISMTLSTEETQAADEDQDMRFEALEKACKNKKQLGFWEILMVISINLITILSCG